MSTDTVATPRSMGDALSEWFVSDYVPRHCAAHGMDAHPFLDPSREPDPAICPHCGKELHYPRMDDPVTGEFWAWRPLPEQCDNPACMEIAMREREEAEREKRMRAFRDALSVSGIPQDYAKMTTGRYSPEHSSQHDALDRVRGYQETMNAERLAGRGLYLCGPTGTGKTHLAVTIAKAALWHGHMARFVESDEMLDAVKRADPNTDPLAIYRNAGLLVIDDLGKEYATSWAVKQLGKLINARLGAGRPTIYTSNYMLRSGSAKTDLFAALSQQGDADCAAAIVSRIQGSTETVMVLGDDYRVTHGCQ